MPKIVPVKLDPSILDGPSCPGFLGANHDGYVEACPLLSTDKDSQPKESWRHPVGGGYAAFAVRGDLAVTIEQRGPKEVVAAYRLTTRRTALDLELSRTLTEAMGGDGARTTPTIAGEHVFALGATGILHCIELLTGKASGTSISCLMPT